MSVRDDPPASGEEAPAPSPPAPARPDLPDERVGHFRAWVGVAIAVVSIMGAVVVWRASVVSAEASDLAQEGIQELILREQRQSGTETGVARDSRLFIQFQEHVLSWRVLLNQAERAQDGDPELAKRLRDEARRELAQAKGLRPLFQAFTRPFYGDLEGLVVFDPRQLVTALTDADLELTGLSPERTRAEEEAAHERALHLVGIAVLFAAALLFLTFAQVGRGARVIYAAAGGVVAITALALFVVVELLA
jgi:type II secretory pathway pseudopilin PulG